MKDLINIITEAKNIFSGMNYVDDKSFYTLQSNIDNLEKSLAPFSGTPRLHLTKYTQFSKKAVWFAYKKQGSAFKGKHFNECISDVIGDLEDILSGLKD